MHIVQIVTQMEGGGSQRAAIVAAREMRKMDCHVETWFLFKRRPVYENEPDTHSLFPHDPQSPLDYIVIFARLAGRLRKTKPDAVLTFTPYANVLGCFFALLAGIKVRVARQTGLPDENPPIARVLDRLFGSIGVYTSIVFNTTATEIAFSHYPRRYLRSFSTVPNGVSVAKPTLNKSDARKKLGLPEDQFLFLTVGRLHQQKNQSRLFEALAGIPEVGLIVAGEGKDRDMLDALAASLRIEGRVWLLGERSPDALGDVYIAADAFIFPSVWESFGIAAMEAAGAGLPLALSDLPALREVTGGPDSGNALFFDPYDVDAIGDAMRALAFDEELREALKRRAPGLIEPYSTRAMATGFLAAMRQ